MSAAPAVRTTALAPAQDFAGLSRTLAAVALAAGVFFAPYLTWRPFDIMFTLSDMLFCAAGLLLALGGSSARRPFGALSPWWLVGFVMMAGGLLLGSLVNGEPTRWAIAAAQYGFALIVLPHLLIGHGPARTVTLAKALLAGTVAMELFGIAIYFFYPGTFHDYQRFGLEFISGSRRLGVFLSDANWNGAYLAMSLPFVGYLYAKRLIPGWQAAIAFCVIAEGLLLAASVTALFCSLTSGIALIVIGGIRVPKIAVAAVALGIAGYFASGHDLPQAFSTRVAPALESGDISEAGTYSGRMGLIHEALDIVEHTTVVGLGVDRFREVSAEKAPVHNMYLLLWSEGGLFALTGWLLMLVVLICAATTIYRRDRMTAALGISVLITLIASSTASPHMYARLWVVPIFVAMAFVFECAVTMRGRSR